MRASVTPSETATARSLLPDAAWPVFAAMAGCRPPPRALDVVSRLAASGDDDQDLLAAALLHDAAKASHAALGTGSAWCWR